MIDTHCHLDADVFDGDRAETAERAFVAGVEAIVVPAIEPSRFAGVLSLADSDARIYCGMGIHPHNALEATDEEIARVEELSFGKKVVAIGEIGLDYYYDFAPKDVQQQVFRKQLQLAKKRNLPVIIHNRDSDDDVLRIVEEEQDGTLRGVFHCFSSSPEIALRTLELGMNISFTGNITYKKSTLAEVVRTVPLDRVMIETDSPYMTPVPYRGKRNEPAFVRFVAEKIAELHSVSFELVQTMTTQTAKRLFKLALLALFIPIFMTAQPSAPDSVNTNPYKKGIGVGPVLGTNTIVATFSDRGDFSDEGIFTIGGSLKYGVFPWMQAELAYLASKNTKVLTQKDYPQDEANNHQLIDFSLHFSPNYANKMNFYGVLGISYFDNYYGAGFNNSVDGKSPAQKKSNIGMNIGVGLLGNIKTSFGLLTPGIEWRVAIVFDDETKRRLDPKNPTENKQTGYFFSIPRFAIHWYPAL